MEEAEFKPCSKEEVNPRVNPTGRVDETPEMDEATRINLNRALNHLLPDFPKLRDYVESSTKQFVASTKNPDCPMYDYKEPAAGCGACARKNSLDWMEFCEKLRLQCRRSYMDYELVAFARSITDELENRLNRYECLFAKVERPVALPEDTYFVVPILMDDSSDDGGSSTCATSIESETASCHSSQWSKKECECPKLPPIKFRHYGDTLLRCSSTESLKPFNLDYVGRSEEIGKWGRFYNLVDRVLQRRNILKSHGTNSTVACSENATTDGHDNCERRRRRREARFSITDFDRYFDIELFGFSTFCREIMQWSDCVTKRWRSITSNPHLIVHLPSMSYPFHLRYTARNRFKSIQSIQIGRLGWLINKNAQVLFVHPGKIKAQTERDIHDFIALARPDVDLSRLWLIANDDECENEEVEEKYRSGCETVFYTPSVYKKLRNLTAGRNGFIVPGVLSKVDVFIACELKTAILGPCLKFQERLLNKQYVMSLLAEAGIPHPPFVGVKNFDELCEKLSEMISNAVAAPERDLKWILKINCGFCGNQSALICLESTLRRMSKDDLIGYLAFALPKKLKINKMAYKDTKHFFDEIERHGGILTAHPTTHFHSVSLGCFIQHDTAKATLRVAAEVLRTSSSSSPSWTSTKECRYGDLWSDDVGYVIPQTRLPEAIVGDIVDKLGETMLLEQYVGFFGVDLVVFEENDRKPPSYWIVDIDPYYTDLLSFDDWRRFCLDKTEEDNCAQSTVRKNENYRRAKESNRRFTVCSGKLYLRGLSSESQNFFIDLCVRNKIAYSSKVKTGCMICPIGLEKTAFLLFSFWRSKETALLNFIRGMEALYSAARKNSKDGRTIESTSNLPRLARDMRDTYGFPRCHESLKSSSYRRVIVEAGVTDKKLKRKLNAQEENNRFDARLYTSSFITAAAEEELRLSSSIIVGSLNVLPIVANETIACVQTPVV